MKRLFATRENQMKKWLAIVGFCVFLIPCAYGETINYGNGDKYVGDVSNGVRHGHGTYTFASGAKYVGEFKDAEQHGHGIYFHPNGDKYLGEYKAGLEHGQGIYTYADGSKYVGEYKDGNEWNGILYIADGLVQGSYIEGVWQAEEFDCVKKREYIEDGKNMIDCEFYDGERYVGGYEEGTWNGQGTYFYVDGSKYIGEYKDGVFHGHGTFSYVGGDKYVGEFKDGHQHGQGTYFFGSGSKYVGEYQNGTRWTGVLYSADGTVAGTFSNGEWIPK
jgi:hypothetical protein